MFLNKRFSIIAKNVFKCNKTMHSIRPKPRLKMDVTDVWNKIKTCISKKEYELRMD